MAKKQRGRPKVSTRDETTVKFDRTLANKAKLIATHKGVTVGEFLSEASRGPIDKEYAKMIRELEAKEK